MMSSASSDHLSAPSAQQTPARSRLSLRWRLVLLKEDGRQFINTIVPVGAPRPVRPNVESTRQVFATGLPAVSNLYEAAVGPRKVVAIDVPVKAPDGAVRYALSLVLAQSPRLQ